MTRESCRTSRRTCLTATLSTTNLTLTGLGLKLGLHGERPATNSLSLGKASGTKIQFVPHSEDTPTDRVIAICGIKRCGFCDRTVLHGVSWLVSWLLTYTYFLPRCYKWL